MAQAAARKRPKKAAVLGQQQSKYPPLPRSVSAPGGRVKVKTVKGKIKLKDGRRAWGMWEDVTRTITMSDQCKGEWMWKVFYHELAHVALMDAGLHNLFSDDMHETLCDAIATARTRERFG